MATVAALTVLGSPTPVFADHDWDGYHWARTANPFTVRLDNNVNSTWLPYLREAAADWNASSVLNTSVVDGSYGSRASCTPAAGRVEVCNEAYGQNGWLGVASISVNGRHITSAFVMVNDTYFRQAKYDTPAFRRLVMCQEVGHAFGLGHTDENQTNRNQGTCMDYSDHPEGPPSNEHPNGHDFDELERLYQHRDSSAAVASVAGPVPVTGPGGSWGRLVDGSADRGGVATYVRDVDQDRSVVTHVHWVPLPH